MQARDLKRSKAMAGAVMAVVGLTASFAEQAFGIATTVNAVSISNLTLDSNSTDVGGHLTYADAASNANPSGNALGGDGVTLSGFRTLLTNAGPKGGFLDFQEKFQGGTWPNQTSAANGISVGDTAANPITVMDFNNANALFSFARTGTNAVVGSGGIDANTNQGANVASGGYKSQTAPGTTGTVDFTTTPPTPDSGTSTGVGGGYFGIQGAFQTDLTFTAPAGQGMVAFGLSAIPRGTSRDTQIVIHLSDGTNRTTSDDVVPTAAGVFWGFGLTPLEISSGLSIGSISINSPTSAAVNRYDDLAFVVAPEPTSLSLLGAGSIMLLRRKRLARR